MPTLNAAAAQRIIQRAYRKKAANTNKPRRSAYSRTDVLELRRFDEDEIKLAEEYNDEECDKAAAPTPSALMRNNHLTLS